MKRLKSTREKHVLESEPTHGSNTPIGMYNFIYNAIYIFFDVLPEFKKNTEARQFQLVVHITYHGARANQNLQVKVVKDG